MTGKRLVIAIDGPAGAGKSTAARALARRLGYLLVDTGALYRAVALVARARGVDWNDGPALGALAQSLDFAFRPADDGTQHLYVDGVDREAELRTPEMAMGASQVSRHPEVRAALLGIQRGLGRDGGIVLEGRDIGTVVFPDAEVKVFLTASAETRAARRVGDLAARGIAAEFETTLREVRARDAQDEGRAVAPLRPATDSVRLDTSGMTADEVVDRLLAIARAAGA